MDKYGTGQDPYCYPGTRILRNSLSLHNDIELAQVERELSEIAASSLSFSSPPYDLAYFKRIHKHLFEDLYEWAGLLRTVDISKSSTRFCNVQFIEAQAEKIFGSMGANAWFETFSRSELINACTVAYGDLNVIHPFREGNGRAQRLLFEHLIINAGFEITWWGIDPENWVNANIAAYHCDYGPLGNIFEHCIGGPLAT